MPFDKLLFTEKFIEFSYEKIPLKIFCLPIIFPFSFAFFIASNNLLSALTFDLTSIIPITLSGCTITKSPSEKYAGILLS